MEPSKDQLAAQEQQSSDAKSTDENKQESAPKTEPVAKTEESSEQEQKSLAPPEPGDEATTPKSSQVVVSEYDDLADTVAEATTPPRKKQNVVTDFPVFTDAEYPGETMVAIPSDTAERTASVVNNIPNVKIDGVVGERWASVVNSSIMLHSYGDAFIKRLEEPGALFKQHVESGGFKIASHEPKLKERQNAVFEGDAAVMRAVSYLGMGTAYNSCLYNTGIWIQFKPPSEEELVELYRQLTSDQIEFGRYSYGLVYANSTSYTISRLCNFAKEHIYRIHASPEINADNILSHIKAQDISSFLWGFASTMYPSGFGYRRACMIDPTKCQHVSSGTIHLRKLQYPDNNVLSEYQLAHLADNRSAQKLTVKDLERYELEMKNARNTEITVFKGTDREITFALRSPTINEYTTAGSRWIGDMVALVTQTLGSDGTTEDKNRSIELRSRATMMRQYSHWVESIKIDTNVISDRTAIERTLSNISGDTVLREEFLEGVKNFIENSSVAVIAVSAFECPACKKMNTGPETYPDRRDLIPIDVVQLFFVLLTQKHLELTNR